MADSTAMTVDFLRARLLSERSVSRAAKERAEQLAIRVAELEEQVRAVTAQRRQAERAASEVLAILESQGFVGHLSDEADDDGSGSGSEHGAEKEPRDDTGGGGDEACSREVEEQGPAAAAAAQGEPEDEVPGTTATTQPGGLSWKGRSVSPRKAGQLKQKHRRSYFYFLSSDPSPKYRMGQSCRKNKRQELRSAAPKGDGGNNAALLGDGQKRQQEDVSDYTDYGQADLDGNVGGGDERSSGDGGGGQYVIRYEKDGGEMARVLERQAELIGQYEAEEEAQKEWEKQFNQSRSSSKGEVKAEKRAYQPENGREANCKQEAESLNRNLPSVGIPSAGGHLPNGSIFGSSPNASDQAANQRHEADQEHGHDSADTAAISALGSSDNSTVTRQDQDQGDENSDGGCCSSYHTNPPSSSRLHSKASDWSSTSRSHDHHADEQLDDARSQPQPWPRPSNGVDIGGVLEALHLAKMSLRAKLSRPVPPSQVMLALPAPGDDDRTDQDDDDGFPVDDEYNSAREELYCGGGSSPSRQEILALPAPEDYYHYQYDEHGRADHQPMGGDAVGVVVSLAERTSSSRTSSPPRQEILALPAPGDDDDHHHQYQSETEEHRTSRNPITMRAAGLFRLPTDTFPKDEMLTSSGTNAYDLGYFNKVAAASLHGDGSGLLPAEQCYDPRSSVLQLSVPANGRCSVPSSDFTVGVRVTQGLKGRGVALADADLFIQRACDYTVSNKWML